VQNDRASDYLMIMFIAVGTCTHEDKQRHGS